MIDLALDGSTIIWLLSVTAAFLVGMSIANTQERK